MPDPIQLDLYTDAEGDLSVGVNGDLLVARDSDVIAQEVLWRLKTTPGDWVLEPRCGAGLESLIGRPNTAETGEEMVLLITDALTHDSFLSAELGEVEVLPLNRQQLMALIPIEFGDEEFTVTVTLDLKEGVLF